MSWCDILVMHFIYLLIYILGIYYVEMLCINKLSESEYQIHFIILNIIMWNSNFNYTMQM